MGDLQVTLEFLVELHKFFNVDLFQRGFYQVRAFLKIPPKLPSKVEVSLPKNSSCSLVFPACVVNGAAVSKTFQILYKNEEIYLDDIISFKTHILLDGHKVREALIKAGIQLVLELWFTDQHFGPDHHSSIQCVSSRLLQLHFDPYRGLHHHLPVMFDYFHLSVVTVTIHSSLLALCQPYLSPRLSSKKTHYPSLESLFFGNPHAGRPLPPSSRLHRGRLVHWELIGLLLASHASLRRKLSEYMKLLPPWQQLKLDSNECLSNLEGLSELAKECQKHIEKGANNSNPSTASGSLPVKDNLRYDNNSSLKSIFNSCQDEEELLVSANSDIAQLCGALVVLWQQFLEIVLGREKVREHLAKQHHHQRVKRFSEAFFLIERPRETALHPCETGNLHRMIIYQDVTEDLRRSHYLNLLPPLEVECVDLDGDCNTLPIIYEEHYQETARRGSSLSRSSQSTVSLCDVGFLLEEPNSSQPVLRANTTRNRTSSQSSAEHSKEQQPEPNSAKMRSPSIVSLSDESPVFSPVAKSPFGGSIGAANSNSSSSSPFPGNVSQTSTSKISLKEKFLNSMRLDIDYEREEYNVTTPASKRHGKFSSRSKIKIRTRTANFLRQFRKSSCHHHHHHHGQHQPNGSACGGANGSSGVILLGFKKIENTKISAACHERMCKTQPVSFEFGMRHSLSTLSVVGTLCMTQDRHASLTSSESMPDLSCVIPPPPPPPRPRFTSVETTPGPTLMPSNHPYVQNGHSADGVINNAPPKMAFDRQISRACSEFMLPHNSGFHSVSTSSLVNGSTKSLAQNQSNNAANNNNASKSERGSFATRKARSSSLGRADLANRSYVPIRQKEMAQNKAKPLETAVGHIYEELCPPSPPIQFRDLPNRRNVDKNQTAVKTVDKTTKTGVKTPVKSTPTTVLAPVKTPDSQKKLSPSNPPKTGGSTTTSPAEPKPAFEECQGTMFFPKPPKQFTEANNKPKEEEGEKKDEMQPENNKERVATAVEPRTPQPQALVIQTQPTREPNMIVAGPPQFHAKPGFPRTDCERAPKSKHVRRLSYFERKCTILEMLTDMSSADPDDYYRPAYCNNSPPEQYRSSTSVANCDHHHPRSQSLATGSLFDEDEDSPSLRRISAIGAEMISFVKAKEDFRHHLGYPWLWYSDFPTLASVVPYFQCDNDLRAFSPDGLHLIVCVHGLDGNSADLRLVRTYLELGLPTANFEFLMSERNQGETFDDFETMTDRLVSEITYHVEVYGLNPAKISFIGHSLGNIIIRSALARPEMKPFLGLLHTFMSLSGPHLGTLYNNSGLVNMGMWFMQKWKKSGSLLQLAMKDSLDPRNTFLYKLSKKSGLEFFRNVLLFGSSQDRYVPIHSARIELCKAAIKDNSTQGASYREMVNNLIQPIIRHPNVHFVRYDIHHALPSSANTLIGRAAHIAVLDSELFIEKFMVVCGLKYFA